MKMARNKGSGGELKSFAHLTKRPPKLKGGVANDFAPTRPRSVTMPKPTKDTKYTRKG